MGLWDKIKGQFIDVIEWVDDSNDAIIWKFPRYDNEIKNGAQLIVRESQVAVFLYEGELGDIFMPGRHELSTRNIPILTSLKSWKYGFDAPFKCDVYYVAMRQFTDLKWGTKNPIMMRDSEFGAVRLRAFGSYCIRVVNPGQFIQQIAGTDSLFQTAEITGQFRNILASRFADALAEAKIPILDLAANYNEIGDMLRGKLQEEFDEYGMGLTKFLIENISLPAEVEKTLDKRTQMKMVGDIGDYTRFQTAEAIEDMANNPNAGANTMGMIAGVGMGNIVGGAMHTASQAPAAQSQQRSAAGPPPLPRDVEWYAAPDGKQEGPFAQAQMGELIRQKRISPDTLVWKEGMDDWTPSGKVDALASFFKSSVPPPLPRS